MDLPEAEKQFLDRVTQTVKMIYATSGGMPMASFVKAGAEIAEKIGKEVFITASREYSFPPPNKDGLDGVRHLSIRLKSPMAALVSESWIVEGGPKEQAEIQELKRQGRSLSEHPKAQEIVIIIGESDNGCFNRSLAIDRKHPNMTMLAEKDEDDFRSWDSPRIQNMRLQFFHIRSPYRQEPQILAFVEEMDRIYGDPFQIRETTTSSFDLPKTALDIQ